MSFSTREEDFFPGTSWHTCGEKLAWRPYKHWGMGVWAAEGLFIQQQGDRSGCLKEIRGVMFGLSGAPDYYGTFQMTSAPVVVQARAYRGPRGEMSAVFSYPGGIGAEPAYFWEIYPVSESDIERFSTEEAMEARIGELLS